MLIRSTAPFKAILLLLFALLDLGAQPTLRLAQSMCGTDSILATLQLATPASSDTTVELRSDTSDVAFADSQGAPVSSIVIKRQANSAQFSIVTAGLNPFQNPQDVTVIADAGALGSARAVVAIQGLKSLTVQPSSVCGGANATGSIQLCQAAPKGGVTIYVTGGPQVDATPQELTIPEGQTSGTFSLVSQAGATGIVSVQASSVFGTVAGQLTLSSFVSAITSVPNLCPGGSGTMAVSLCGPAPAQGLTLLLSSNPSFVLTMPPAVLIPAGQTAATFTVTAPNDSTPRNITVTADAGAFGSQSASVKVGGPISLTVIPTLVCGGVQGGGTSQGTVQLCQAPTSDTSVFLYTSGPAALDTPVITFPANSTEKKTFGITTFPVSANSTANIEATAGILGTATTPLSVQQLISGVTLNPHELQGGNASVGTVTLSCVAPPSSLTVKLTSSNVGVANVQTIIPVLNGQKSAQFPITTVLPPKATTVTITATDGVGSKSAVLTVDSALKSLRFGALQTCGGSSNTVTITLANPATSGATVLLASNNPGVLPVPSALSIPAGAVSVSTTLTPSYVSVDTSVTITATYLGSALPATVTVTSPHLASFTLNFNRIGGGAGILGTVALSCPSSSAGKSVTLASSLPLIASLPGNVTVASGSATATFPIRTTSVSASTAVTFTAADGSRTRAVSLTLDPILLSTFVFVPNPATGGTNGSAMLTLNGPAPQPGVVVTLSASSAALQLPSIVTISSGASAAPFDLGIPTVGSATSISVTASTTGFGSITSQLQIFPLFSSLTFDSNPVFGGRRLSGTITLSNPAPSSGIQVLLTSSDSNLAQVPPAITIGPGQTVASFPVLTAAAAAASSLVVTAASSNVAQNSTLRVLRAVPYFSLTDLGTLGGPVSQAKGIDKFGRIVGWADTAASLRHAFLWDSVLGMRDLHPSGYKHSEAWAIAVPPPPYVGRGYPVLVAGRATQVNLDRDSLTLWNWPLFIFDGSTTRITDFTHSNPPYTYRNGLLPHGISSGGEVVGQAEGNDVNGACAWSRSDPGNVGAVKCLASSGATGSASAINSGGRIVGASGSGGLPGGAVFWANLNAPAVQLGFLAGGNSSNATSINDSGQVVGFSSANSIYTHAFSWQPASGMQDLNPPGYANSAANAINNLGQIVGQASTSILSFGHLWQDDQHVDLNTLLTSSNSLASPCSSCLIDNAFAINDAGQIAVELRGAAGNVHAALLNPIVINLSPYPLQGNIGDKIIIGQGFSGVSAVWFGGTPATFSSDSAGQLTAAVPQNAHSGAIAIATTFGTAISTAPFAVITVPTVTVANSVQATFSPNAQSVTVTARVTSPSATVSVGAVTFTLFGAPLIAAVSNGLAGVTFNLPPGTAAGTYPIKAMYSSGTSLASSGDDTKTLTIGKATPAILWSNPVDIIFGTALGFTQLNATGGVVGSFSYSPSQGTILPVGSGQTLSVVFAPQDGANYNSVTATVRINVLPSAPAASPAQITVTKVLTRDASSGDIIVSLGIANSGGTSAVDVQVSSIKINTTLGNSPPQGLGTISPGGTANVISRFPGSLGLPGQAAALTVGGAFQGGSFSISSRIILP